MNWDAIGALGEAFSALGFFFVLVRVRHARVDMRRSVLDAMSDSITSQGMMTLDARVLGAITKAHAALGGKQPPFVTALIEQAGLTEEEARLIALQQQAGWQTFARALRHIDALSPGDRAAIDANLHQTYANSPVSRLWYQHAKATSSPSNVRYVDGVLARSA